METIKVKACCLLCSFYNPTASFSGECELKGFRFANSWCAEFQLSQFLKPNRKNKGTGALDGLGALFD